MSETTNQTESLKSVPLTPSGMHLLAMLMEAFESTLKAMVDKRVDEVLGTAITTMMLHTGMDDKIKKIVDAAIEEHTCEENHHDIDNAVEGALNNLELADKIEHEFKHNVNWEDYVDERVRDQVEELVPSDDEMHDKIRMMLNDVTFTVSVD